MNSDIAKSIEGHGEFIEYKFLATQDQKFIRSIRDNLLDQFYINGIFTGKAEHVPFDKKLNRVINYAQKKENTIYSNIATMINNNIDLKADLLLYSLFPSLPTIDESTDSLVILMKKLLTVPKDDEVYSYILNKNSDVPQNVLDKIKIFEPIQLDVDKGPFHIVFNYSWYKPVRIIYQTQFPEYVSIDDVKCTISNFGIVDI